MTERKHYAELGSPLFAQCLSLSIAVCYRNCVHKCQMVETLLDTVGLCILGQWYESADARSQMLRETPPSEDDRKSPNETVSRFPRIFGIPTMELPSR